VGYSSSWLHRSAREGYVPARLYRSYRLLSNRSTPPSSEPDIEAIGWLRGIIAAWNESGASGKKITRVNVRQAIWAAYAYDLIGRYYESKSNRGGLTSDVKLAFTNYKRAYDLGNDIQLALHGGHGYGWDAYAGMSASLHVNDALIIGAFNYGRCLLYGIGCDRNDTLGRQILLIVTSTLQSSHDEQVQTVVHWIQEALARVNGITVEG
jgi:TPR repeat protein